MWNGKPNPNYPTWPGYVEGSNPNYYSMSIENEGFGVPCTYGANTFEPTEWTDCQYETNAYLIARAAKRWGFPINSDTVVRHGDVYAGKRGRCPGPLCDMDRIITRANEILPQLA